MDKEDLKIARYFLKDSIRKKIDFRFTDQNQGVPIPPIEKNYSEESKIVNLPPFDDFKNIQKTDLTDAIGNRKSHRVYYKQNLSLDELAYLLWSTQGLRGKVVNGHGYRNVPSAGCRHALETYLAIFNVDTLDPGMYRYLPLSNQLVLEFSDDMLSQKMTIASLGQPYPGKSAVTFIWTAIPYRMEWRYGLSAHKVIALDAGHVCQNLYLACESIDAGACAIAAYDQEKLDELLRVDGEDEFAIYLASVGKIKQ
jgi:SagB-type dehydrogenase family enzyme